MDETEVARKALLPEMPDHLIEAVERGEQMWNTDEFTRDFEVLGFMAPFVVVRRRVDSVRGSLKFTGNPRWYFGWQPE